MNKGVEMVFGIWSKVSIWVVYYAVRDKKEDIWKSFDIQPICNSIFLYIYHINSISHLYRLTYSEFWQ